MVQNNASPALFCFRNDLRLTDNAALTAAANTGKPLLLCYVLDDETSPQWKLGGASRWWLHHSLTKLIQSLKETYNAQLILRKGAWAEEISKLAKDINASDVYWSRNYEPYMVEAETTLKEELAEYGIQAHRYAGHLLFEPEQIYTKSQTPYAVFTPFWRNCLEQKEPKEPLDQPESMNVYGSDTLATDTLEDWELLPTKPNWASTFTEWTPGEESAYQQLKLFIEQILTGYAHSRDIPSVRGTSKLSPHLHFGEISPRQIWHAIPNKEENMKFLAEIGWREFSYHLLTHNPTLPTEPYRPEFAHFPWHQDSAKFARWQQGQTGIPIVDAGMRQLWQTGWMHNRVRMIVASLLVKNMLIPWQEGAAWFWDTLVDADLASNSASWQWVAGSGADAAPYFRIFNPVTQSQKFDAEGEYIRTWVPEIKDLPNKYIHAPWEAPQQTLADAGVTLGKNYPKPIVDLKKTRQAALNAYASIKR